jgi:oxygen-independent coproporphyrinogen-3 oxidase
MLNNDIIKEEISIDLAKGEYFWLGLRKIDGVSIKNYIKKFNSNPFNDFKIEELINKKLLIVENDMIKLTKTGLDFGNYVFSYFV